MEKNPFDQFDNQANTFDQFDAATEKPAPPSGAIRRLVGDKALGFASGAIGATKAIADVAGAGNRASQVLSDIGKGVDSYLSPEAKADQQEQSGIMAESKGKGTWEGIKAGARAFGVAPVQTAVQGLGSVVPILAGTAFTGGGLPAAAAGAGIGAAMGAGTAKGAIFDEIKKRSLDAGMGEAEATAAATKAQEYGGANTDQIALGGVLGTADALTGVAGAAGRMARGAMRKPVTQALVNTGEQGILRRMATGVASETPLEAAQGGQEQIAANLAAQRAGYQAGTFDNVASNATLEALASAGPGAAFGALEGGAKRAEPTVEDTTGGLALAGDQPPEAAPVLDPATGGVIQKTYDPRDPNSRPPLAIMPKPEGIDYPEQVKPSARMGIDPAAGPISSAAALAVDSGAHQTELFKQAEQAAIENEAKKPDSKGTTARTQTKDSAKSAFKSYEEAQSYITEQKQRGTSVQALPLPQKDGSYSMAMKGTADYTIAEFHKKQMDMKAAGVLDGDILTKSGDIFAKKAPAVSQANKAGAGHVVVPVQGGFVIRKQEVSNVSQPTTVSPGAGLPAAGPAPVQAAGVSSQPSDDQIITGKRAAYQALKKTGAPEDVISASVIGYQEKADKAGAPMTLWRSKDGALGLVPAANKSPFALGEKIGTIYPTPQSDNVTALQPQGTTANAASPENPGTQTSPAPSAQGAAPAGAVTRDSARQDAPSPEKQKALDRIASGKAWFGSGIKAQQFIAQNGLKATHKAVKSDDGKRWDVVPSVPGWDTGNASAAPADAQALPPALSAKLQEAHKALGRDVTRKQVQSMRDRIAKEANTRQTNNGGVIAKLTPLAVGKRMAQLARLDADLALFDEAKNQPTTGATSAPQAEEAVTPEARPETPAAAAAEPVAGKDAEKAKWIKATIDRSRLNGTSGVQIHVAPNGGITFLGNPSSNKDGQALLASYEEALKAGATQKEIAAALVASGKKEVSDIVEKPVEAGEALQSAMGAAGWAAEVAGAENTIWTKRTKKDRYTAILTPESNSMEITVLVDTVDTQIASFKVADPKDAAIAANKAVSEDVADSVPAAEKPVADRTETEHAGLKIYPVKVKMGDAVVEKWAVQTPDNAQREKNGERQIGGDPLSDTLDEAKKNAESEVRIARERAERDAESKAEEAAAQSKKDANKGKSILQRRADALLDKKHTHPPQAGLGQGTRREAMQSAVYQGRAIVERMVPDTAAKNRDQAAIDLVRARGYILGASNENIPVVKQGLEAQARMKANQYEKPEYRVYDSSKTDGGFYAITKTEFDYAKSLLKQKPKDQNEADAAIQNGNVTREFTSFMKDERDSESKADRTAAWRGSFAGNFAETIAAGDISRSDYEKLSDFVAKGKITESRASEMIASAVAAGVLDARVGKDMTAKVAQKPVNAAPVHQDPGEKPEAATAPVIAQSLKTAGKNEDKSQKEMRLWLLGEIDAAVKLTEDYPDYLKRIAESGKEAADSMYFKGKYALGLTTAPGNGMITFDVPGDGKFKVRNSLRGLMEFRAKVDAKSGTGFTDKPTKPKGLPATTGVAKGSSNQIEALSGMLEDLDFEAAVDYARETGISLNDAKISSEVREQFKTYLKDGTEPTPFLPSRYWEYPGQDGADKDGNPIRRATLTKQIGANEYQANVIGTNATGFKYNITKDGKSVHAMLTSNSFANTLKLAEDAINAIQPEVVKPKDTGWNMSGVGFAGKRYRGRNITLDDGREVVARIYENAGQYEDAEVKVDGVSKFRKTDRYKAEKLADDFIRTLTAKEAAPAKAPIKVTPQVSGNAEKFIKVAADSVDKLRQVDVERVLSETPVQFRAEVSSYIKSNRDDLVDEVDAVLADLNEPAQDKPAESKREFRNPDNLNVLHAPIEDKDWFKLKNGEEWQARQGYSGRGWSLVRDGSLHPEARNFESQADFIRSVIEVTQQTQAPGQVAAPAETNDEPIPAVTEAQARKQFEWRNMGQKDGTKSHLLFFFESEKDKGTGAAMNRGEVSLYPGASGWKVEDGDGTSYKSLADAKKAAIDLAIPKLQDQGYILKPAAEATAILDAANVTGKERIEALKDVKKGDITPEELQAAYPAKDSATFPNTTQGAIDAFNADDSTQAVAIMAKLKLDDLKEVGGAIGFRPQNGENAKAFRERIGTVADKLTKTSREQTSREMTLHKRLTQLASDYDRAIAHRDRAIANGAEAGSSAFEGQYEGQWTTIDKGLAILENALQEESKSPDYAKVSAMVKEARPAIFDAAKPNIAQPAAKSAIGDFGQKIGGAKKDTWTGFKDDLNSVKDDDIASRKLSEIWPAPDYQKMIDDGMDAKSVALIRSIRDEVPSKPRSDYKLRRWAEQVKEGRALALSILNEKNKGDTLYNELTRIGGKLSSIAGRADLYMAVGHEKSLEGIRLAHHHYSLYKGRENVSMWVAERDSAATAFSNFPQELATGDTKEQAIAAFKAKYDTLDATAAVKKAAFVIFTKGSGDKGFYIGKKIGRNIADMAGPFAALKEARAYRESNLAELEAKLEKYKEIPKERRDTNEPRVGEDMRNGQDVTPEMFSEAFGFKGVEFGNWVEQKRRQKDLNDAFDALMDMAAIMGVPAKAISLNGELGLAFGARGSGGVNPAAAHYESDKIVINLTKREGAGSLGHEWWHALDNYFSRQRGGRTSPYMTTTTDVGLSSRGSNYVAYDGVRKEMIDAFGEVVKSIRLTAMKARSSKMDAKRTKEYWTTGEEMAARAFESYLISKLHDQNASNDYLANVVDQKTWDAMAALGMENEDSYPYPTAGEMPLIRTGFDKFFQTLETKETDKGVAMFSRGAQTQATAKVQPIVDAIKAGWKNAPPIVVAFDLQDPRIPERVRQEDLKQRSGGAVGTPEGFFYKGTVYLMSSKVKTANDVARVLAHETLGHYGLRGMFGDALTPILRQIAHMRKDEVRAKAIQYGLKGITDLDRRTAAEEVLAEMAQNTPEIGFVRRAIAAIRTWLRRNVPGFKSIGMTDDEIIRSYILPARRWVERGAKAETATGMVPAFGRRQSQTDTPAFKAWFGDSKVVDAAGKPLVVYHGTAQHITKFTVTSDIGYHFGDEVAAFDRMSKKGSAEVEISDVSPSKVDVESARVNSGEIGNSKIDMVYSLLLRKLDNPRSDLRDQLDVMSDAELNETLAEYGKQKDSPSFERRARRGSNNKGFAVKVNGDTIGTFDTENEAENEATRLRIAAGKPVPVYLSIKNPITLPDLGVWPAQEIAKESGFSSYEMKRVQNAGDASAQYDVVREVLSAKGYDGIVYENTVENPGSTSFIAFVPEQIKSATGNNGNFDPTNPDIRFARGEPTAPDSGGAASNQGGRSADDTTPGAAKHPFAGFTREKFLGNPKITSDANARDLVPSTWKSLESVQNVPFAIGDGFTARFGELSAAVYNAKGEVVASYSSGDTLVVNKKYRRQGIGSELVYQWRMQNPNSKTAATRTKKSQALQEKVWDRIRSERALHEARAYQNESTAPDSGGAPMFSRSKQAFSPAARSQATDVVERQVARIKSKWKNAPKIIVAFDMADERIPAAVRAEDQRQRSGGAAGTPEGFYYGGTVYLMSSQLKSPGDVQRVLFHETLGHFGLRGTFGDGLKPILQQIATFRKAEVDAKIKEYGLRSVPDLDRLIAAEEVLAEMAQNTPEIGFVKRAIAMIRTWLRENGFSNLTLTDDEIITQLILPARAFVEQGGKPKNLGGNSLMRSLKKGDWYSELSRQVMANKQQQMPAGMWASWIDSLKTKGVKPDEIEWSGVTDWLKMQPGKVTKQQVLAYLDANGVQVQETVLGEPDYSEVALWWNDEGGANEELPFDELTAQGKAEAAERYADEVGQYQEGPRQTTKYANYTLPGGTNYREVLLTLPSKNNDVPSIVAHPKYADQFALQFPSGEYVTSTDGGRTTERTTNPDKATNWETQEYAKYGVKAHDKRSDIYKSSHWDATNVLAHIRVNDRTDSDGKRVLFVEELQSDWGQDGKKQGFSGSALPLSAAEENRFQVLLEDGRRNLTGAALTEFEALLVRRDAAAQAKTAPPLAPFVTATDKWLSLALKRVIKMAVDGGYDRVAFVTGQQSADRYDLSKSVDSIKWRPNGRGGGRTVNIEIPSRGNAELLVNENGKVVGSRGAGDALGSADGKQLDEVIGKEIASKIMQDTDGDLSGNGLKVGGEGMKAFYDKIVPNTVNALLKKVGGGKVETVDVGKYHLENRQGGIYGEYATRKDAEKAAMQREASVPLGWAVVGGNQPGFTITPAMQEKAAGGMPMFSRSTDKLNETLKNITVTDIKARTGNKLADYRGLGLQFLGGRQIVDLYGKEIPQLNGYTQMVQQMSADANEVGAQADKIATGWANLKDERQLAELMHDATLAQIDPAKPLVEGDNPLAYGKLNGLFKALSDDAKKVYREARDAYEEHYAQVREAIRDKIERSEMSSASKAAMLARMDNEFFDKIKGVYFPLARFGKYVVVTRGPTGVVNVSRAETLNEAQATRELMRKAYPSEKGFMVGKVIKDKEFNASRDAVGRGFLKELFGVLDEKGMGEELQDAVNQLYLASMPDLSWAKHGIHRKGTPGFSQDARRAFAQNMFHGARYLAKLRYADQLADKLVGMQNYVESKAGEEGYDSVKGQQVVDEINKRHDSLMNPKSNPLSTALTSFGFVFHMGLSPASAIVNLSGTAMVAYPIMGAKWGFDKAATALMKAGKEAATHKNDISQALSADEKRAYDAAVKAGTIDVTAAHDLAGIAQGEDAGVMWKLRPVMKWASFLFHHAERFNRQITFVAAYRLARETGANPEAAFEQATKATYDGHFDYAASNRPRVMQGNAAKVLLLFKQYGQNMVYTLTRQAQQAMNAETPEQRRESRKALAGLLVMHAAGAGVLGLPLVGTLLAAASMIGGSDDEPWDAEVALRNMLADAFGQKPAEVLARGLSRLTPWDISGRVGLDKLILPDIQEGLEGQRLGESVMAAALGPVAGIGINVTRGMQEISEGHLGRGIETMMPAAFRAPLKALRYEMEGAKDKTGVMIKDEVGLAGVAGQALGFSPSEVRNATEGRSAIYAADKRLMARRSELMAQYAQALIGKDTEGVAEAMAEIRTFNEKNPNRRINGMQLAISVKNRNRRVNEAADGVYLPKKRRDMVEEGRFAVPQ